VESVRAAATWQGGPIKWLPWLLGRSTVTLSAEFRTSGVNLRGGEDWRELEPPE